MITKNTLLKIVLSFLFVATYSLSVGQTTVQMQKVGGVWVVPCKVNGLDLDFIFDSGASSVSISLSKAVFMIKNGYLSEEDILDTRYFTTATGDVAEGTEIILKQIDFAGLKLYSIKATIVNNLEAPLLLGQSAISELGEIKVDFTKGVLTVLNSQYNINQSSAIDYLLRGTSKMQINDYYGAIHELSNSIEDNPNFAIAYNIRGGAKMKLGDYRGALQDYNKVIDLNPFSESVYSLK